MQLKETQKALNAFGRYVVKQARTNLTKNKKNSTKKLYDSLEYDVQDSVGLIRVFFKMEDYGVFQDSGVSGVKKKYNTPYSYKDKMPPPSSLDKWIVRKGLKGIRDEKGRFIKRKSLQFIIARSIYTKGIKPSLFFTKPFNKAFGNLDKALEIAYSKDLENNIE
jgi:hypothetical protein